MKPERPFKPLLLVFTAALLVYCVAYLGIEHRRTRKGPWQVTFTTNQSGAATLIVSQPALAITNFKVVFPDSSSPTNVPVDVRFNRALPVPYDLPFGQCIFQDTTFLPGTIVLNAFGHEIQLIPRTLTIDHRELAWESGATISVTVSNATIAHARDATNTD